MEAPRDGPQDTENLAEEVVQLMRQVTHEMGVLNQGQQDQRTWCEGAYEEHQQQFANLYGELGAARQDFGNLENRVEGRIASTDARIRAWEPRIDQLQGLSNSNRQVWEALEALRLEQTRLKTEIASNPQGMVLPLSEATMGEFHERLMAHTTYCQERFSAIDQKLNDLLGMVKSEEHNRLGLADEMGIAWAEMGSRLRALEGRSVSVGGPLLRRPWLGSFPDWTTLAIERGTWKA